MNKSVIICAVAIMLGFSACTKTGLGTESEDLNVKGDTQKASSANTKDKNEKMSSSNEKGSSTGSSASTENYVKSIYFDYDKYNIRSDMESVVEKDAELLKSSKNKEFTIKVEGNCDEWGSDEYNYALGLRRAKTVKEALIARGINKNRILMVSYGESNPKCSEHNKECWAKNRRADLKLLP